MIDALLTFFGTFFSALFSWPVLAQTAVLTVLPVALGRVDYDVFFRALRGENEALAHWLAQKKILGILRPYHALLFLLKAGIAAGLYALFSHGWGWPYGAVMATAYVLVELNFYPDAAWYHPWKARELKTGWDGDRLPMMDRGPHEKLVVLPLQQPLARIFVGRFPHQGEYRLAAIGGWFNVTLGAALTTTLLVALGV